MKALVIGKYSIIILSRLVNLTVLTLILLLISFAGYALWDSKQIHEAADRAIYAVYKPSEENQGISFKELQEINPDVIAWLSIYGTGIDYPVTQGLDNMQYVNTNAEGMYSLSGAIFLDSSNSRDFSDFNSILYGHHMAKKMMFGEIGDFADRDFFEIHQYGNLYYNEKDHGIEFFLFIHASAYDRSVFTANITDEEVKTEYLDNLIKKAIFFRDIGVTKNDRIILLSTCSVNSTNGRDILVGRITDEIFDDPFINRAAVNEDTEALQQAEHLKEIRLIKIFLLIFLIVFNTIMSIQIKQKKSKQTEEGADLYDREN